jgi:hypothetical protein
MDEARDQLLAGTGFADDEDVAFAVGDDVEELEYCAHPRGAAEDNRFSQQLLARRVPIA